MSHELFYFCVFLSIVHTQFQPLPIRTATLTPDSTSENGATVSIIDTYVVTTTSNPYWSIDIPSWMNNNGDQIGFDMLVNLNSSWGFHASKESTIEFTIYSDQSTGGTDKDLIISFSVGDSKYFSVFLTLDNNYGNAIYPHCGGSLATGDINSLVSSIHDSRDRESKAFGQINLGNLRLQPVSNNYWPITFTIRNNPSSNRVYIYVDNPNIQQQTCEYGSAAFPANQGLQIYIASDEINDSTIYLKQFKIDYSYQLTFPPTMKPTKSPTNNPTQATTRSPTKYPTVIPSNNPTQTTTRSPTNYPTSSPSNNPTKTPSKNPTTDTPTIITLTPSLQPSVSPTNIPTKIPTKTPSNAPTNIPTITPTQNPTNMPTFSPIAPSFTPTQENAGHIDETQVTAITEPNDGELNAETSNDITTYIVVGLVLFGLCLCCIFGILFICQKKKQKQLKNKNKKNIQQHTNALGISNKTHNKYGKNLRLNSLSPSTANTNQFVIATDISISNNMNATDTQIHFENNLTSAVGVNKMLMDDIVNEMDNEKDVIHIIMTPNGQTPRLPSPPKRVKSNENINIQMSNMNTPNGMSVDTGSEGTGTDENTDDIGTNESVMDKTYAFTNHDDDDEKDNDNDDLDIMDNIVMTPEKFGDHKKRTLGGDSDDVYEYGGYNPNLRHDEFVIGSPEGGVRNNYNNNHLTKQ